MSPINPLYSGFDPLWGGHKKDLPTLLRYLKITSKVYYLVILLNSFYVHFVLSHGKVNEVQAAILMIAFFVPLAVLFYMISIYRGLRFITPHTSTGIKVWKWLFGFWMILFLLLNLFQIVVGGVGGDEYLFSLSGTPISYSLFVLVMSVALGVMGELLLNKMAKAIKSYQESIGN